MIKALTVCRQKFPHLSKRDGEVDLVELAASGERRALPPALRAVHRLRRGVRLGGDVRVAVVAHLALDHVVRRVEDGVRVRAGQLAETLGLGDAFAAGGGGGGALSLRQVVVGRRQRLPRHAQNLHEQQQHRQRPRRHHAERAKTTGNSCPAGVALFAASVSFSESSPNPNLSTFDLCYQRR